jgi:hypothetical protein
MVQELKTEKAAQLAAFKEAKDPINTIKDFVLDHEKAVIKELDAALATLDATDRAYQAKAREEARKEQERLQNIERERARKEAEAEAKRLEALAAKKRGEAKQELKREAEQVRTAPPAVSTVTVEPKIAAGPGLPARRQNWKARVVDEKKLWQAVLDGKVTRACFVLDQKFLDGQAGLLKDKMNDAPAPFPGVEAYDDGKLAAGR